VSFVWTKDPVVTYVRMKRKDSLPSSSVVTLAWSWSSVAVIAVCGKVSPCAACKFQRVTSAGLRVTPLLPTGAYGMLSLTGQDRRGGCVDRGGEEKVLVDT
jgi:hypothetical protein